MSGAGSAEEKTVADVRASTRFLLDSFKAKMEELRECGEDVKRLLRFGVDYRGAEVTAREFFGSDTTSYVAVDGTDSVDQQLDLLVFYVGAFAYSGEVRFTGASVEVGCPEPTKDSYSVSAAIPLSEEDAAQVFGQRRESGVEVDPERLPSALMHLAEYYLAYRAVSDSAACRVLLLDRTLAGDVAHLVWSTRDLVLGGRCVLEGMETPSGEVTGLDLELARMVVENVELGVPAPRSQLLKFAAVLELSRAPGLTARELLERVGADQGWEERLRSDLEALDEEFHLLERTSGSLRLRPGVSGYWERVMSASEAVARHIFGPEGSHPLRVVGGRGESWVTADDLDFLVLVFIRALTREAWARRVLPIGFIKDSNAFELVKAAVPVLEAAGEYESTRAFPNFNSDKMLLQTNSVVNGAEVPTPWRTVEIDAAFRTMAPVRDGSLPAGEARVNGAYENVIYPERVYVKTYIQLWSSANDPSVRSHVFTYDRPVFPHYDHWDEIVVRNRDGPVDGRISPVLHYRRPSSLTNLVMAMLAEMAQEVIPESLGHNYPLFLADKKAKAVLEETRRAYSGAVALEMAKSDLDQQVLFSRRFRDYRSQVEGKRKG